MNIQKRQIRARRKAKSNRLARWNGVPQMPSKFAQPCEFNAFPDVTRNLAPKFTLQETGRFLRTVVIQAGQRITQMIPILKRVHVKPQA